MTENTLEFRYEAQKMRICRIVEALCPGSSALFDARFKPEAIAFSVFDGEGCRIAHFPAGVATDGLEKMTDEEIVDRIRQDVKLRVN